MTKDQKQIFATRPMTWQAMRTALRRAGCVAITSIQMGKTLDSHRAPLGEEKHWKRPQHLPALAGKVRTKMSKSVSRPAKSLSEKLWWFHTCGRGSSGPRHEVYEFVVFAVDTPEVFAEFDAVCQPVRTTEQAYIELERALDTKLSVFRAGLVKDAQATFDQINADQARAQDIVQKFVSGRR